MPQFLADLKNANSMEELIQIIHKAVGDADLMEFIRFDLGHVVKKKFGPQSGRSLRILVGNPLTMSSMTIHVPDAGSYAPVTILIDERPDGVHISHDAMESFLIGYENEAASQVARELDEKVSRILEKAAD
jgi:uncharacterized protein (DUF302 family)